MVNDLIKFFCGQRSIFTRCGYQCGFEHVGAKRPAVQNWSSCYEKIYPSIFQEINISLGGRVGDDHFPGQIIRRVINLVQEVEDNMVELIRLSGGSQFGRKPKNNEATVETADDEALMRGIGPQVPGASDASGSVSGQDEVDDLLSSLGF